MKKYLITEDRLRAIAGSVATPLLITELKPIEPLDDETIDRMWYEATAGSMHRKLARAIERHILGETP